MRFVQSCDGSVSIHWDGEWITGILPNSSHRLGIRLEAFAVHLPRREQTDASPPPPAEEPVWKDIPDGVKEGEDAGGFPLHLSFAMISRIRFIVSAIGNPHFFQRFLRQRPIDSIDVVFY